MRSKHYIANNQEQNRHNVSANLHERTLVEVYLQPYEGAIEAGAFSFMCSNNRVNQEFSCENSHDINYLLHQKLNWTGFVLSDYRGTQSTVGAALGGLDI